MGSKKRRVSRRSAAMSQKSRFPIGALAAERAVFKQECLSKHKELKALKKKVMRLKGKISEAQDLAANLENNTIPSERAIAFVISSNAATARKDKPTILDNKGNINLPRRSAYRRQKETLLASAAINRGSIENPKPALDGMFSTITKYGKTGDVNEYLTKSGQFRTVCARLSKQQVAIYEK